MRCTSGADFMSLALVDHEIFWGHLSAKQTTIFMKSLPTNHGATNYFETREDFFVD